MCYGSRAEPNRGSLQIASYLAGCRHRADAEGVVWAPKRFQMVAQTTRRPSRTFLKDPTSPARPPSPPHNRRGNV